MEIIGNRGLTRNIATKLTSYKINLFFGSGLYNSSVNSMCVAHTIEMVLILVCISSLIQIWYAFGALENGFPTKGLILCILFLCDVVFVSIPTSSQFCFVWCTLFKKKFCPGCNGVVNLWLKMRKKKFGGGDMNLLFAYHFHDIRFMHDNTCIILVICCAIKDE